MPRNAVATGRVLVQENRKTESDSREKNVAVTFFFRLGQLFAILNVALYDYRNAKLDYLLIKINVIILRKLNLCCAIL